MSNNPSLAVSREDSMKSMPNVMPTIFASCVCLLLIIGWRLRDYELITPGRGLGLMFGITGTGMMILLLSYSVRKHFKSLRTWGPIKIWFCIHMILGILGPVLILFHANFHLGALNSNVALFSMLIVSGSGIIGRYIYGKIHNGLYGEKANLVELEKNFNQQKDGAAFEFGVIPGVAEELKAFSESILSPAEGLIHSIMRMVTVRWQAMQTTWKIKKLTSLYIQQYKGEQRLGPVEKAQLIRQVSQKADSFMKQAKKVSEFNFYERLFSLWHMTHLPMVYVLGFSIIVHVIAVRKY